MIDAQLLDHIPNCSVYNQENTQWDWSQEGPHLSAVTNGPLLGH